MSLTTPPSRPARNGEASPFAALEQAFGLLTAGPCPLALDGARIGSGLPLGPSRSTSYAPGCCAGRARTPPATRR